MKFTPPALGLALVVPLAAALTATTAASQAPASTAHGTSAVSSSALTPARITHGVPAQEDDFDRTVLVDGLSDPFEILFAPDEGAHLPVLDMVHKITADRSGGSLTVEE